MKTEDLKNYIFEQCLTEAKIHPLVKGVAQFIANHVGGDPIKIAGKMTGGINRTTNKPPTLQHVYNAAQFHFGEILRKNSPSMDRPEVYADMRTRLRAHLGMDGTAPAPTSPDKVNEDLKRRRRLANESAFNFIMGLKRLNEYYNSEHTRIDKMSLPEKKKFYNAIKREKVSDQEDREERRERLDLIKHARNSIKNHQDSTTDTKTT